MSTVISVENVSKSYRLGAIGGATLKGDFSRWWAKQRGKTDPLLRIGEEQHARRLDEEFWALQDVSFQVQQGEVLGIIGRNGAGKSTLLKILSQVTSPTAGKIKIKGRIASLLEVGTGFHPELTGRENVFLNGAILGMTKAEIRAKFDEIIAFSGIEEFIDTPVKRYSSGMYVRLAFAVAAHLEPEILIVDEVLAVGDAEFQSKCLGKMDAVAKGEGRSVLFVSHNMGAVEQLCSRILFMADGHLKRNSTDVHAVAREYLFPADRTLSSEWRNTGHQFASPMFHPLHFRIVDGTGTTITGPVPGNAEFWIEFEARIEQIDPALTVGYAIYAEGGEVLYWSYQTDTPFEHWPVIRKGLVKLRSRLPERFFNEGLYKIELIASLHQRVWFLEPGKDVPSISLRIQGGLSNSPYWYLKRPGLLAPVIAWKVV